MIGHACQHTFKIINSTWTHSTRTPSIDSIHVNNYTMMNYLNNHINHGTDKSLCAVRYHSVSHRATAIKEN
jgi:hypothetical protein